MSEVNFTELPPLGEFIVLLIFVTFIYFKTAVKPFSQCIIKSVVQFLECLGFSLCGQLKMVIYNIIQGCFTTTFILKSSPKISKQYNKSTYILLYVFTQQNWTQACIDRQRMRENNVESHLISGQPRPGGICLLKHVDLDVYIC